MLHVNVFQALKGCALSILVLWTIAANSLVFIVLYKNPRLQTVPNLLVGNLAFSDLCLGIIVLPLSSIYAISGEWLFPETLCVIFVSADILCSTASIWNLSIVGLDRYWAITTPVAYMSKRNKRTALVMILSVWVSSALISLAPLLGWKQVAEHGNLVKINGSWQCTFLDLPSYTIYSATGSFFIPTIVMFFVYYKIYQAFAKHRARQIYRQKVIRKHIESTILHEISHVLPTSDEFAKDEDENEDDDDEDEDSSGGSGKYCNGRIDDVGNEEEEEDEEDDEDDEEDECSVTPESSEDKSNESKPEPSEISTKKAKKVANSVVIISRQNSSICDSDDSDHFVDLSAVEKLEPHKSALKKRTNSVKGRRSGRTDVEKQKSLDRKSSAKDADETVQQLCYSNSSTCETSLCTNSVIVREQTPPEKESDARNNSSNNHSTNNATTFPPSLDTVVSMPESTAKTATVTSFRVPVSRIASMPNNQSVKAKNGCTGGTNFPQNSRLTHRGRSDTNVVNNGVKTTILNNHSKSTRSVCNISYEKVKRHKQRKERIYRKSLQKKPKAISAAKERRGVKVLGIILGCFTICWTPFFVMYVVVQFCSRCLMNPHIEMFITWLGYSNSAMNPIIYTVFNRDYQIALKRLFTSATSQNSANNNQFLALGGSNTPTPVARLEGVVKTGIPGGMTNTTVRHES